MTWVDFFRLTRPVNVVMAMVAALLGYWLGLGVVRLDSAGILAALTVGFVSAGGHVINDFFDVRVDQNGKRDRPLASGRLTPFSGLVFAVVLFGIGLVCARLAGEFLFVIAFVFVLALSAYSGLLSKFKWIGNFVVAFSTAFTFVFGALSGQWNEVVLFVAASAFFLNLARELVKDLEDREMDAGAKTALVHVLGERMTLGIVLAYAVLAIGVSFAPLMTGWTASIAFGTILIIANAFVFLAVEQALNSHFSVSQKWFKVAMAIALVGFFSLLV